MAIDYIVARDNLLNIIGYVDMAKSVIWHRIFYSVGDFEIYVRANNENALLLQKGNYVSRDDDLEVGVIEKVELTHNAQDGFMLVVSGRFAKSLLDRRIIYTQLSNTAGGFLQKMKQHTTLTGNVESAARSLVANNAISCSWDTKRNFRNLILGSHSGSTAIIVDESGNSATKQVTHDNLLTYTDGLLQEYNLGARFLLDTEDLKFNYSVYSGNDLTVLLEPVIFSKEFDNFSDFDYLTDDTNYRNTALIGGEGEGAERYYCIIQSNEIYGARREMFVDASDIRKTYEDENDEQKTYPDETYKKMLTTKGQQNLATLKSVESFSGTIDTTNSNYKYKQNYDLGDIVQIQDDTLGVFANVKISEVTEVQDENGYTVAINYI